jgi:nucleotide-binding universal stress UspA family protein
MVKSKKETGSHLEIKRILVPTDFSECSRKAEECAGSIAKVFKAEIFLLHVMELASYSVVTSWIQPPCPFDLREGLVEMTRKQANKLKESGIEAEGYCISGVPSIEILKAVEEYAIDLVVMGTHGRTGLAHILLGSTAERVIQRVQCPVLTIKEKERTGSVAQFGLFSGMVLK